MAEKSSTPEPTLLDAISAGIDEVKPKAPVEPKGDDDAETPEPQEVEVPDETDDEKTAREAAEAAADDGKPPIETAEEKTAREAAEAAAAEETAEQKAEREAAEAAAKKPLDPVGDPIPATVSARTRERITALITLNKEKDAAIAEQASLFTAIASTGVTPDNFSQTLTFLRLFNSPNIEDKRTAYNFMKGQLEALATEVGEFVPGTDPLAAHPDLKAAVEALTMSQEHALELATARARTAAIATAAQRTTQATSQQQQAYAQAHAEAIAALNAVGATLSKVDPQYAAKYAVLIPKLKPIFATMHPSQWAATFHKEYTELKLPGPNGAANGAAKPGQPLRPKQPAGGAAKQPTSMAEALDAGLALMKP